MAPTDAADSVVLGVADLDGAMLLSEEAGWNQTSEDWTLFLRRGEGYGIRAGNRLVASAAFLPYGDGVGWISMVLVTAQWRRRGLASQLMNRCIDAMRARGSASLLDATPEGAKVYRRLGFTTKCGMSRWRGTAHGSGSRAASGFKTPDRSEIFAGDRVAFGSDREFLIDHFLDRPGTRVIGDAGNFVILRDGRRATQIGPLVAHGAAEAEDLLQAALAHVSGPTILDVLDAGTCLEPLLRSRGFEAFRNFERMVLDRDELPGIPSALMVAAGPEFG